MELNWVNIILMSVTIGTILTPIAMHFIKAHVANEVEKLRKELLLEIEKLEKESIENEIDELKDEIKEIKK